MEPYRILDEQHKDGGSTCETIQGSQTRSDLCKIFKGVGSIDSFLPENHRR